MSWFGWNGSNTKESSSTVSHSDDQLSSELTLHSDDSPYGSSGLGGFGLGLAPMPAPPSSDAFPPTPVLALDQIKSAGVSLNRQMTPYLQIDPSMFANTKPEYIIPDGGKGKAKFEFALGHIGWAVGGGYVLGCVRGFVPEFSNSETKKLGMFSKPWMTRIVNATVKHGAGYAQPAGAVVFMYSAIEIGLRSVRADDDLNSLAAGALSGAIYRSPHGLRASGIGAGAGLVLAAAWSLINLDSRERMVQMMGLEL